MIITRACEGRFATTRGINLDQNRFKIFHLVSNNIKATKDLKIFVSYIRKGFSFRILFLSKNINHDSTLSKKCFPK